MDLKAFAVTPGLKHKFTGRQLAVLGAAVGADAIVELTTVQQLLVQMDAGRAEAARAELHGAGLKTYAVGAVVKNLRACSFCQGDEEEGYAAAVALDEALAGMPVPFPLRIAYTGCPNGCAEPLLQDIGVVKADGGFQVYVGGRASGLSPRPAVLLAEGIREEDLTDAVRKIVQLYQAEGQGRERFWKFVDRIGLAQLAGAIS
jgi:NAD(P)H-nitrite reductase large subunit